MAFSGLFVSAFLSSSFFPGYPDVIVAYMVMKGYDLMFIILLASVGSYLGFCSIYLISFLGRELIIEKIIKIDKNKIIKAEKLFKKYGSFLFLFAWVPLIGESFVIAGGILRANFYIFSIYAFLGTFLRFVLVAYFAVSL